MDPNVHEAFDRLKEEGKVRFLGVSTHTPRLVDVATRAIESGRFDVMMLAYHHGIWPTLARDHRPRSRRAGHGHRRDEDAEGREAQEPRGLPRPPTAYAQAALRWVLANPNVSCAVVSFFELQHVDEYLVASGGPRLASTDVAVLRRVRPRDRRHVLRAALRRVPHPCPEDARDPRRAAPPHVLRGLPAARRRRCGSTRSSSGDASVCAACSAPCLGSCPIGISIQERMVGAHDLLTLA